MKQVMKQLINPEAFVVSIEQALCSSYDIVSVAARIKKRLSSTPDGTLHIRHDNKYISFYHNNKGQEIYLKKDSDLLYGLAQKRYLALLLNAASSQSQHKAHYIDEIKRLIFDFAQGNLDIARIVLTKKQYNWYTGKFKQKPISPDSPYKTVNGIIIRSKSERDIGTGLEDFVVPYHFEERTTVNVLPLVQYLENSLRDSGKLEGNLFFYKNNICMWRVPKNLEWMNQDGSVWKTYNYRTGCLHMHNDFRILLADDELILWEHEGWFEDFTYRSNATERIAILEYMDVLPRRNIIRTFERDVANRKLVNMIIQERILPRLWF